MLLLLLLDSGGGPPPVTPPGVSTFAAAIARRDRQWGAAVTIEGIGDAASGLWYLCDALPQFATAAWRPWLTEMPDLLAERVDPKGGLPEAGEVSASILDYGDGLSAQMQTDADPMAFLVGGISASATTVTFTRTLSVGSLAYVGAEAMIITGTAGGLARTVTRGALGTEAYQHRDGDAVRAALPSLRTRRLTVYVYPLDGTDASTMREIGSGFVDTAQLDSDMNVWVLRGKSSMRNLSRVVARVRRGGEVVQYRSSSRYLQVSVGTYAYAQHGTRSMFLRIGDELMRVEQIAGTTLDMGMFSVMQRGVLSTRSGDIDDYASIAQVWLADDASGRGCFLVSPGPSPSTSRTSGTWVASEHWIDIMLCLLTSSAHEDDGLELTNYLATGPDRARSNWASLPVGVGVGLPIAQIDVLSMLAVQARTRDALFSGFEVGSEAIPFGDLITDAFLRPLGAYVGYVGGRVRVRLPRALLPGEGSFDLGPTDILSRSVGRNRVAPRIGGAGLDLGQLAGTVRVTTRSRRGGPVEVIVNDSTYPGMYGQRGYYGSDEGAVSIDAPASRTDDAGRLPYLERAQLSRLYRWRRPPIRLEDVEAHDSLYDVAPGDVGRLTLDEVPDTRTGVRGVTSLQVEVVSAEHQLDRTSGSRVTLTLTAYGAQTRVGRVCPAAVASGASSPSGSDVSVPLVPNRYTAPDAPAGYPATDAAAFAVGDVVQVYTAAGVPSGSPRAVVAVGTNALTLAGSTAVSSGAVIAYAPYASQTTTQRAGYVSMADRTDLTIGAGSERPWQYGEA
jgi:hypothetical protein